MKISVIIVSFNTQKLLKDCLNSIFKKTKGVEIQVIVVDNASSDGSQEMVRKNFPKVTLIENKKNLGFAAGNNIGIKKAKGEHILLLNSDTRLVEDSLTKMVGFMEKNPKIGISSCQLIGENGEIQASGGFFPNLFLVFAWMFFIDDLPFVGKLIRSFHPHAPWYKSKHFQDWVTGAFFLISRNVVDQIGFLDENFFMYVEEMEYCFRAKKKDWQVVFAPITKIIHLGGQSSGTRRAIISEYQGLKYFFAKHKKRWETIPLRIFLRIGAVLRIFLFGIIKQDKEALKIYAEAFSVS